MSEHQGLARRDHGQRPSCLLSPSIDRELSDRATGDTQTGPGLTSHWAGQNPVLKGSSEALGPNVASHRLCDHSHSSSTAPPWRFTGTSGALWE